MVWVFVIGFVIVSAVMIWALSGMGTSLGVYKEEQRLNDEADALEQSS
jgi:hypothetical protein